MHDLLINYINRYISNTLQDSDIELIKSAFVAKKIRRKQYLLQEGEVCKYIVFIVNGAMRQYTVDSKGGEHIIENWWAADRESFIMLTPSIDNIDAWEDTEALTITRSDQEHVRKGFLSFLIKVTRNTLRSFVDH